MIGESRLSAAPARVAARASTLVTPAWGWLPLLTLVVSGGLLLVAFANTASRYAIPGAEGLFWVSLLLMYVPVTIRVASPSATRREVIGLVMVLGLALYLVKILHSPFGFTFPDEFAHWRTADDILRHGRLLHPNPLLPVTAQYPGLDNVTAGLVSLSGLSIFQAGLLVVGVARLVLVLAMYLFYEQISRSSQIAGVAVLVYMANPNFVYFLSAYKYQSLAIPLAVLLLYSLLAREHQSTRSYLVSFLLRHVPGLDQREAERYRRGLHGMLLAILLCLALVITTHHMTSYALTAFLLLWAGVAYWMRDRQYRVVGVVAVLTLVATLTWLFTVGNITVGYLAPHIEGAATELGHMLMGEPEAGRTLFGGSVSAAGSGARPSISITERLIALGSVLLLLAGMVAGWFAIWREQRRSAIFVTLALATLAYPASLALRLTNRGWEIGNRASEFAFLALGLVVAYGAVRLLIRRHGPLSRLLVAAGLATILVGGLIAGWPPAWRLAGPYLPMAGARSIEPHGMAAAMWVRDHLGPDNIIGADRTNMALMASYGQQEISKSISGGIDTIWVLFAQEIGSHQERSIQRGRLQYMVVDRRIFTPQLVDQFFPGYPHEPPLQKFEFAEPLIRIYDNGDIVIYEVGDFATTQ
jgi:hypothetical protein